MLGLLIMSLALLTLSAIAGCSPRLSDMMPVEEPIVILDTVEVFTTKTLTDTFMLAAEAVPYFDSVLCPPGLIRDTMIYVNDSVWLPARAVEYTVTVHDTVFVPQYIQTPGSTNTKDMSWPERLTWLSGLMALLVAWWNKWKDAQPNPTT